MIYNTSVTIKNRGVTLLLAVLFLSASLSIALGIFYVVYIQLQINRTARDSHVAFFSADAGKECALYYYQRFPGGDVSLGGFWNPTNPCNGDCGVGIQCIGQNGIVVVATDPPGGGKQFNFRIRDDGMKICSDVTVVTEALVNDNDPLSTGDDEDYTHISILTEGKSSCVAGVPAVNRSVELCYPQGSPECL